MTMVVLGTIPNPPTDMATPATTDAVFSTLSVLLAVGAVLFSIHLWRRDRTAVPLLIVLGGATAALIEPIVDVNGGCWWPRHGGWTAFHLFGTPVPVWAVACYFWFVGGQAYLALRYLKRHPARRTIWKLCAAIAAVNFLLETPGLSLHIYRYWGHQPLNPYGWPLWWAAVNVGLPLVGAMLVYKLEPLLTGWRLLLVIPLLPMGDALANGATAWPAWLALHSNWPMPLAQMAGVAVFGLAGLFYWTMSQLLFPDRAISVPPAPPQPADTPAVTSVGG
jgi:hypothetical protein